MEKVVSFSMEAEKKTMEQELAPCPQSAPTAMYI